MTLKKFRELTEGMHEDTPICYHAHDHGCCLMPYDTDEFWLFPKFESEAFKKSSVKAIVMNPGADYDPRKPKKGSG